MKKTTIILVALFMILNISVSSQTGGVVISNGTATADPSAMLDVQSTTKGMLVPRMTSAQRTAISSPATGLLIFDNTTGSFWFYNGSTWEDLSGVANQSADADNDTKVQVEESTDEDIIRFDLAGTEHWKMTGARLEAMNSGQSVFIGEGAGAADDLSDNKNVFVGYNAGQANTTGQYNTAYGDRTFETNTTGNENTATGHRSLQTNITGNQNTAIGKWALFAATGSDNTAVGYHALSVLSTGINNTAIGSNTAGNDGTYSNGTAIGAGAMFFESNYVMVGNSAVSTIGGYTSWTSFSDGRFKTNLKENVAGLDFIMKLRPLTYHFDMEAIARFNKTPDSLRNSESEQLKAAEVQIGFIAQEVEETATALGFDFHGVDKPKNEESHYGLRYAEFVVPLVKAMQEQQAIIEKLEKRIEELEQK